MYVVGWRVSVRLDDKIALYVVMSVEVMLGMKMVVMMGETRG